MQDGRNTREAPKGVWNIYFPAFCLSSTSNHSQQNRLFAFSRSLNQYPLPSSSHAKLGPSVASVMMMAARPSKALKAISLTLERERLALGILEHWSGFEISNEEQEGALPVILLSVMHLVFCISISVPHNNFIVARNKNMYIYIHIYYYLVVLISMFLCGIFYPYFSLFLLFYRFLFSCPYMFLRSPLMNDFFFYATESRFTSKSVDKPNDNVMEWEKQSKWNRERAIRSMGIGNRYARSLNYERQFPPSPLALKELEQVKPLT